MDEGLSRVFNKQLAKVSLGTKIIGKKILAYDLVTSTNDLAHFLAQNQEPEGTVLFAKGQTQGRGRMGHDWLSPYGDGLYFSFILRPDIPVQQASRITLTIALGLAKALEKSHVPGVSIKWPNDILVKNKKAGGILTEMSLNEDKINYIVAGVGLNVNTPLIKLPEQAISLKEAARKEFDIADLSHIIMRQIDHYYEVLLEDDFAQIIQKVKELSSLILGARVRVAREDRDIEGYAVDFDEYGGLIIRLDNGFLEKVYSGHLEKCG
jgi:BirA family biotin operon repressor/biotin-[acetyl-CoA-carboxylase] ligase